LAWIRTPEQVAGFEVTFRKTTAVLKVRHLDGWHTETAGALDGAHAEWKY
jgi:hypothetical protein